MKSYQPKGLRGPSYHGYAAPRDQSPSPIGWERAGVRALDCACLFWRFSFDLLLTHSARAFQSSVGSNRNPERMKSYQPGVATLRRLASLPRVPSSGDPSNPESGCEGSVLEL